jgi:acetamidase/formamidase
MRPSNAQALPARHRLAASRPNICVGYFDNHRLPALRVASGDTVYVETLNHFGDGVSKDTLTDDLVEFRKRAKQYGPHTVTGPIYVAAATPGDTLAITIGEIRPRRHGYNFNMPGKEFPALGALPEEFPDGQIRHFELDLERKEFVFASGIHIPLGPFPGIVAVSPPGRECVSTIVPGAFGGNMDLKELTEGSVLYLPVFVEGALLWVGDAHAAQGDGEVNLTAVECAFESIELNIATLKGSHLKLPRAETDSHWITMGFHESLDEAFRIALKEMINFIVAQKGLTRLDAYSLCSIAVDFRITQVVDGNKGVHGMLPKAIFKEI